MTTPLIAASDLQARLAAHPTAQPTSLLICDCSFDLTDAQAGARSFEAGHLPGARYVNLDADLSAPKTGRNGRHPLPSREAFAQRMAALGAGDDSLIVVYDGSGGMYAARLWWMLRWVGHARVCVLDGGLAAWRAHGGELVTGPATSATPAAATGTFSLRPSLVATFDFTQLLSTLGTAAAPLVVDARSADRFRGENETLDPIGGHIPGARNRFFRDNLGADGRFKPAEQLRAEWREVAGDRPVNEWVMQCGSGVTACHNLLALEAASLPGAALYPGSWSEWCAQPDAPIARG